MLQKLFVKQQKQHQKKEENGNDGESGEGGGAAQELSSSVHSIPSFNKNSYDDDHNNDDTGGDDNEDRKPSNNKGNHNNNNNNNDNTDRDVTIKDEKDYDIPFFHAIKCASQVYCDKIISSCNDMMGVVLYGTRESKNQFDFNNVYIYQDIDTPDANRIKQLESMSNNSNVEQFEKQLGHAPKKGSLHDALWTCQHLFSQVAKNVAYKRIFLFTNDDDPFVAGDATLRKKCMERARDLMESDVMIELFVLGGTGPNHKFDSALFWQHVLYRSDDEYTGQIYIDGARSFQQLLDGVRRKTFTKRALSSFELELRPPTTDENGQFVPSSSLSISVSLYNLLSKTTRPLPTRLHAGTNKPTTRETKQYCEYTGTELMASDIKYCTSYGGKRLLFEPEEIKQIKSFGPKGMRLMGFKPRSRLKLYQNYRNSAFLYPTDAIISGSHTAFSALHRKMVQLGRIAICRFISADDHMPVFVALVPQEEVLDPEDNETQIQPPGFNVLYLPYADSIRSLDQVLCKNPSAQISQKQIDKAKLVVKRLNVDMNSAEFDNPVLQRHHAVITALALERENMIEPVDHMQPDVIGMRKYQSEIDEFRDAVMPHNYLSSLQQSEQQGRASSSSSSGSGSGTGSSSGKRKRTVKAEEEEETGAADEESGGEPVVKKEKAPSRKKVKKERNGVRNESDDSAGDDQDEEEAIDMVALAKSNQMGKLTVPVLKEFCKVYGIKPKGTKKADIIASITQFLRDNGKI